jgi:hypothetical protein
MLCKRITMVIYSKIPMFTEGHLEAHILTTFAARRQARGPSRPGLQWDDRLARHAQRWADHLISRNSFEHDRSGTGEGENLAAVWGHGARQTFTEATNAWLNEITDYNGEKIGQGNLSKYGHYTQVC